MNQITNFVVFFIGIGVLILVSASIISASIIPRVPQAIHKKWLILFAFINFFIAGYAFFISSFLFNLNLPLDLLTGIIFLAGAIFVFIVISLARTTIFSMSDLNIKLKDYSESLDTKVKEKTAELNQIFETAADGMRIIDKDFNVIRVNKTLIKMMNLQEEDVLGKKCFESFKGDQCNTSQCPHEKIISEGFERFEAETVKKIKGANDLHCIVTATPFRNSDGKIVGIVEDFKDISLLKEAEKERELVIKKLETALAEIKTLHGIIPICMYCKKIRNDEGSWDKFERYISDHSDADFSHGVCPDCLEGKLKEVEEETS